MHWVPIIGVVALAGLPSGGEAQPPGAASLPEPIATRQFLFSIPFQVDRPEQLDQEPVEVQLYVSVDRGATWHQYSKVDPKRGHFLFRAGGDGEFWFLIRTLDRSGQLRPALNGPPGLRVVVDSTPPKLELQAERGVAGQVTTRWQVDDANVDLATLKIQYRTDVNAAWQFVAVDRSSLQNDGTVKRGQVTWWLGPEVARVEVRAEVADTAGNPAVTHAQLDARKPSASGPLAALDSPPRQQPVDFPVTDQAPGSDWRASADAAPASRLPACEPVATQSDYPSLGSLNSNQGNKHLLSTSPYANDAHARNPYPKSTNPSDPHADDPYGNTAFAATPRPNATAPVDAYPVDAYTNDLPTAVGVGKETSAAGRSAGGGEREPHEVASPPEPAEGSVAIKFHPPIPNQDALSETSTSEAEAAGVPPGETVQPVNSRVFELEYDVESVGPAGIARVELWGTRDGGRTWSSFGIDADHRSPLLVTVHEEGIYGFRVVVRDGAGRGGKRPQAGDQPDVWIGVDQTKPTAQILAAEQDGAGQARQLVIRWQAEDTMLADRPVSLRYSDTAGGPWTLIADELANSGRYVWSLDGREPKRLYLRLEVRDRAGNVAVSETPSAIALDQFQPVVRIREVRPLGHSAQTPPRRYFIK